MRETERERDGGGGERERETETDRQTDGRTEPSQINFRGISRFYLDSKRTRNNPAALTLFAVEPGTVYT